MNLVFYFFDDSKSSFLPPTRKDVSADTKGRIARYDRSHPHLQPAASPLAAGCILTCSRLQGSRRKTVICGQLWTISGCPQCPQFFAARARCPQLSTVHSFFSGGYLKNGGKSYGQREYDNYILFIYNYYIYYYISIYYKNILIIISLIEAFSFLYILTQKWGTEKKL